MREVGVILNGVTGRMGTHQHLMRSIVAIIRQGGVRAGDGEVLMPRPVLVGRSADKLRDLAEAAGVEHFTTDLDEALADPLNVIYFDSQATAVRAEAVRKAIDAGKAVYCEKPSGATTREALDLAVRARRAGVPNGVVHDMLFLPGIGKLKGLLEAGRLGRVLSVRGEFGYWVFEGDRVEAQRPSWNYRKEDGGGIIMDMFCHWRYVLEGLFAPVRAVSCTAATHVPRRWDEQGRPYGCTAEDAAYATFDLAGGAIVQFNSSWAVRVRRDDLLTVQVDGADGSAVAGLRQCWWQPYESTPRPVWNPDEDSPIDFRAGWTAVEGEGEYDNAFKAQWEQFLRHAVKGEPFCCDLMEGAKGVQLAELAMESWRRRTWIDVPPLEGEGG